MKQNKKKLKYEKRATNENIFFLQIKLATSAGYGLETTL